MQVQGHVPVIAALIGRKPGIFSLEVTALFNQQLRDGPATLGVLDHQKGPGLDVGPRRCPTPGLQLPHEVFFRNGPGIVFADAPSPSDHGQQALVGIQVPDKRGTRDIPR